MADDETRLVIFDCDGVLVDSEPISVSVLVKAMNDLGVQITEEEVYGRFLGKSLATVIETMKNEYQVHAGEEFLERIRTDLYARFRRELKPIEGIGATIDALGIPCCVASSSQVERIRLSLTVTGLIDKLPNIFSASMVKNGKPAPDLFLHAAREMQCRSEELRRHRGQPGRHRGGEGRRHDGLCLYRRVARQFRRLSC